MTMQQNDGIIHKKGRIPHIELISGSLAREIRCLHYKNSAGKQQAVVHPLAAFGLAGTCS